MAGRTGEIDDPRVSGRATAAEATAPAGLGRNGWLILAVVAVVVPLAIAVTWGSIGVPRDDDWAYLRALSAFADHHTLDFQGWASMALVGQLVLFTPLALATGNSMAALQVGVVVLGFVGLAALAYVGLCTGLSRKRALAVSVLVAVGPLWASLAASFNTDVPGLALGLVSLALGAWALRAGAVRWGWLAASLLVGFGAYSIREHFIVVPLGVLAAVLLRLLQTRAGARQVRAVVWLALLLLAGVAAFYLWRHSLSGSENTVEIGGPHDLRRTVIRICRSMLLIGVLASPTVLFDRPRHTLTRAWAASRPLTMTIVAAVTSLYLAGLDIGAGFDSQLLVGNYVSSKGSLDVYVMGPDRPNLIPPVLFVGLALIGAGVIALGLLSLVPSVRSGAARRWRSWDVNAALVSFVLVAYTSGLLVLQGIGAPFFDRYFMFPAALTSILLARRRVERDGGGVPRRVVVALAAFALLGLVFTTDSAAFDAARWRFASSIARSQDPQVIDGGLEWRGWHRGAARAYDSSHRCTVIEIDVGQGSPDDRRWKVWSLTRETKLVAIEQKDC